MSRSDSDKLASLFAQLSAPQQETLMAFAEFLASREPRHQEQPEPIAEPLFMERPSKESVIAAIKRLSASYPMLDKAILLNETSALMTQHMMQGRPAPEVIDELENLFDRTYQQLISDLDDDR